MDEKEILLLLGLIHLMIVALSWLIAKVQKKNLYLPHILFSLSIPLFGAICSLIFVQTPPPDEERRKHLIKNDEIRQSIINPQKEAERTVPVEESFLINAPRQRRIMMLNMLRSDPEKFLDLLLLARFNDDPETAHFATATLTEVQRQIQLDVQLLQSRLEKDPDDTETIIAYAHLLNKYIQSGLIEGRLLERHRHMLLDGLSRLADENMTLEMALLKLKNQLALHNIHALAWAEEMTRRWPDEENAWMGLLEACITTGNRKRLMELKQEIAAANVIWTRSALERMQYFLERDA